MNENLTPSHTDVSIDSYGIVIHNKGQVLFQYEKPSPWEDPTWIKKKIYRHEEIPPLELGRTSVEQHIESGNLQKVVLYTEEIDVVKNSQNDVEKTQANMDNIDGYKIKFDNGDRVPIGKKSDNNQKINLGKAIDYLISEHNLENYINVPYRLSSSFSKPLILKSKRYVKKRELNNPFEFSSGLYLDHMFDKDDKKKLISTLAEICNTEVDISEDFKVKFETGTMFPKNESSNLSQKEITGQAIEYLNFTHGVLNKINLPYYVSEEYDRPIITKSKSVKKEYELDGPYRLSNGWYFDHRYRKDKKMKLLSVLAGKCGLNVDFYGDWN